MDPNAPDFLETVERLIATRSPERQTVDELRADFDKLTESPADNEKRGALGFLLFCVSASEAEAIESSQPDQERSSVASANVYLSQPSTRDYICRRYRIEDPIYTTGTLSCLKSGTTSFILRLKGRSRVLKIIKPYYKDFQGIQDATKRYAEAYGDLGDLAPRVYNSNAHWVDMEFVSGGTLNEYARQFLFRLGSTPQGSRERLKTIREVMPKLCQVLRKCLVDFQRSHLDLSPHNIMVSYGASGEISKLVLIDFGFNYLLTERVGSAGAFARAQAYLAPELQGHESPKKPKLADVYSLGIIFLELLGSKPMDREISAALDEAWLEYPDFAKLIENMIDGDPANRLAGFASEGDIFDDIDKRINDQITLFEREHLEEVNPFMQALSVGGPLSLVPKLHALWRRGQELARLDPGFGRLVRWALILQALHLVTMAGFVFAALGYPSRRWCGGPWVPCVPLGVNEPTFPFSDIHLNLGFAQFDMPWLSGFLPGRIVALSFSFLIAKYYVDIFSRISTREVALGGMRSHAAWTEVFMRGSAVVMYIPILWAMFIDPKAWAFCSGSGLLWIAINNELSYRLALSGRNYLLSKQLTYADSVSLRANLTEFGQWGRMVGVYALCLFLMGFLVVWGYARDEFVYAIIVAVVINIVKMYQQNCTVSAPGIRALLDRVFSSLLRCQLQKSTSPS